MATARRLSQPARPGRLAARLLIAVLAGLVVTPASSPAAASQVTSLHAALGIDCSSPPDGQSEGMTPSLDEGPKKPRPGDPWGARDIVVPFAPKPARTTIYEQYAWGGASWTNYDLGCGPDASRDPANTLLGTTSNFGFTSLAHASAATAGTFRAAADPGSWTGDVDATLGKALSGATGALYEPLWMFLLVVLALITAWQAPRAEVARAVNRATTAGALLFVAAASVAWAMTGGPLVDRAVTTGLNTAADAVSAAFTPQNDAVDTRGLSAADTFAAQLQYATVYQTWQHGAFGSAGLESPAARAAAPCLFRASALNHDERVRVRQDPKASGPIWSAKQDSYRRCAGILKDADPESYRHLRGKANMDRNWAVTLGWLKLAAVAPLSITAAVLLTVFTGTLRLLVWILPMMSALALLPAGQRMLRRLVDFVGNALLRGVIMAVVGLTWTPVAGLAISQLDAGNQAVLLLVLLILEIVVLAWMSPWKQLTSLATSLAAAPATSATLTRLHEAGRRMRRGERSGEDGETAEREPSGSDAAVAQHSVAEAESIAMRAAAAAAAAAAASRAEAGLAGGALAPEGGIVPAVTAAALPAMPGPRTPSETGSEPAAETGWGAGAGSGGETGARQDAASGSASSWTGAIPVTEVSLPDSGGGAGRYWVPGRGQPAAAAGVAVGMPPPAARGSYWTPDPVPGRGRAPAARVGDAAPAPGSSWFDEGGA